MNEVEKKLRYQHISLLKRKEREGAKKTTLHKIGRAFTTLRDGNVEEKKDNG